MSAAQWGGVALWLVLVGAGSCVVSHRAARSARDAGASASPPSASRGPPCAGLRDTAARRPLPFSARRRLDRNHRIVAADVARIAGQTGDTTPPRGYLRCRVDRGDSLDAADVAGEPVISTPSGYSPYVLSLRDQSALVDLLDVGDRVDVWRGATPVATNLPVLAVWCRPGDDAQCAGVVTVSEAAWQRLAKPDTAVLRILLRRLE